MDLVEKLLPLILHFHQDGLSGQHRPRPHVSFTAAGWCLLLLRYSSCPWHLTGPPQPLTHPPLVLPPALLCLRSLLSLPECRLTSPAPRLWPVGSLFILAPPASPSISPCLPLTPPAGSRCLYTAACFINSLAYIAAAALALAPTFGTATGPSEVARGWQQREEVCVHVCV